MPLSVIGAGFGRTGTYSLKLALEILGFGPCCHGFDERHFNQSKTFWQRVFNHEAIDWDSFFQGYRSTVDSPSCRFYFELAEKYPSGKVILTLRDPNDWFESYKETVFPLTSSLQGDKYFSFLFGSPRPDRETMVAAYQRHNAEVQRLIPPDRLLVYEVAQGWPPLCRFLDVPIPSTSFPLANLREEFPSAIDTILSRSAKQSG